MTIEAHPARIAELERLRAEVAELRLIRVPKRDATDDIAMINMQPDDPHAELAKAVRLWQVEAADVERLRLLLKEAIDIADYEASEIRGKREHLARIPALRREGGVCSQCANIGRLLEMPGERVFDVESGAWRVYGAADFHRATMHNLGISFDDRRRRS